VFQLNRTPRGEIGQPEKFSKPGRSSDVESWKARYPAG